MRVGKMPQRALISPCTLSYSVISGQAINPQFLVNICAQAAPLCGVLKHRLLSDTMAIASSARRDESSDFSAELAKL